MHAGLEQKTSIDPRQNNGRHLDEPGAPEVDLGQAAGGLGDEGAGDGEGPGEEGPVRRPISGGRTPATDRRDSSPLSLLYLSSLQTSAANLFFLCCIGGVAAATTRKRRVFFFFLRRFFLFENR